MNVLICDDDDGILEMLQLVLEAESINVKVQPNSPKIFDDLADFKPDVLVLDLWMPVIGGEEITRQLRSMPEYAELPILVISASRDGREVAEAAGATAYLAKPFDIDDFSGKVRELGGNT